MRNLREQQTEVLLLPSQPCPVKLATIGGKIEAFGIVDGRVYSSAETGTEWPACGPGAVLVECWLSDTLVSLFLSTGEILQAPLDHPAACECVGIITGGIDAVAVDASEQYIAVVSVDKLMLFSAATLELLREQPLAASGAGKEEIVSVGWGRKETQFHGSAGKAAALQKDIVIERLDKDDHRRPTVVWRGDHFCVSSVDGSRGSECRKLRVYDSSGQHVATSEPVAGLEWTLDWCPDVSAIASTQKNAKGQRQVVFFERNGLRHHEFVLPRTENVQKIGWNPGGTVLCILYADGVIQLWTTMNYHWYLKYEFSRPTVVDFWWEDGAALCSISAHNVVRHTLVEVVDRVGSTVAVVDGHTVHLTPFHLAQVPPPMSFAQVDVGFVPAVLAMAKTATGYKCAAQSSTLDHVLLDIAADFDSMTVGKRGSMPGTLSCFPSPTAPSYIRDGVLHAEDGSVLADGVLTAKRSEISSKVVLVVRSDRSVAVLGAQPGTRTVHFDTLDALCDFDVAVCSTNTPHLVAKRGAGLYVDNELIVGGCLSVLFTPDFTFATTTSQKLISLPNHNVLGWRDLLSRDAEETSRLVEPGAVLVCCDTDDGVVTLLMPRGNLESIHPRSMVLKKARELLNKLEYREAYLFSRRHRVDLHFVYHHNRELFMRNLERFVAQVPEPQHLNLFLSSLSAAGATAAKHCKDSSAGTSSGSINEVCTAMIDLLSKTNEPKYAETIMTAHVCSVPSNVEAALAELVRITAFKDDHLLEKSIKYLAFLVPAEHLYQQALGMYNLPLALTMAKRSAMDPKEYVALVESLAKLDLTERRFRIDDHLQRYAKATASCLAMWHQGSISRDAFVAYVCDKKQYMQAIELSHGDDHELLDLFGCHLEQSGRSPEAGLMYTLAKNLDKAKFLETNGLWTDLLLLDRSAVTSADFLKDRPLDRARYMYLRHAREDCTEQSSLVSNHEWIEALVCSLASGQTESLHSAAKAHCEQIMQDLAAHRDSLQSWMDRWEPLQLKYSKDPVGCLMAVKAGSTTNVADDRSELSFAGTGLSRITGPTSASTKRSSKKKQDKRRLADKPGSPHERLFLQHSINETVKRVHEVIDRQVQQLVHVLLLMKDFSCARRLQTQTLSIVTLVDAFKSRLDSILKQQREQECMELVVLRLLLEDSYTMHISVPDKWTARGWVFEFLNPT